MEEAPQLTRAVIPVGYRSAVQSRALFLAMRCLPQAVLVETRWSARTRFPGWSAVALRDRYRNRYVELGSWLGNVAYREKGRIQIADLSTGIRHLLDLLEKGQSPVLLLCACREYEQCHRQVVCEKLKEVDPSLVIWQPEQLLPWLVRIVW